jgi:hypothetical protein
MAGKITEEQAQEILARFQAGTTSLREERERLGVKHNGSIRHALRRLVGDDAYAALVKAAKRPRSPVD